MNLLTLLPYTTSPFGKAGKTFCVLVGERLAVNSHSLLSSVEEIFRCLSQSGLTRFHVYILITPWNFFRGSLVLEHHISAQ